MSALDIYIYCLVVTYDCSLPREVTMQLQGCGLEGWETTLFASGNHGKRQNHTSHQCFNGELKSFSISEGTDNMMAIIRTTSVQF